MNWSFKSISLYRIEQTEKVESKLILNVQIKNACTFTCKLILCLQFGESSCNESAFFLGSAGKNMEFQVILFFDC